MSVGYKVLAKILYHRLEPIYKMTIGSYQTGFRAGMSTIDNIFLLRQIGEKSWEFNRRVWNVFIDFSHTTACIESRCGEFWPVLACLIK